MTNQHPLTDEILEQQFNSEYAYEVWNPLEDTVVCYSFSHNDMRTAYNLAIEHVEEAVRRELKVWRRSGYVAGADAVEDFFEGIMPTIRPQEDDS